MTSTTKKDAAATGAYASKPRKVEVIGPKGNARFRMSPLDTQRVTDLFSANDAMMAMQIAA